MHRNRRLVAWIGLGILFLATTVGIGHAEDPKIILTVEPVNTQPGGEAPVSIFIQNLGDSIQAFQMGLNLSRPDLIYFDSDTAIQTCIECADSACTSFVEFPCTVEVVPATKTGTLIQPWEYVQARTSGQFDLRITGISDNTQDEVPGPLSPFTSGILVKVIAQVFCDIPDTLQDRTVTATISSVNTFFSDTESHLIQPLEFVPGQITVGLTFRGDLDGTGERDAVDLGILIDYLFVGGPAPCPAYVADLNCDTLPDVLDMAFLIDLLFVSGPLPPC